MSWLQGRLRDIDRQLLTKAGITTRGKMIVQFYPENTYRLLLQTENTKLGARKLRDVRRTYFGIRPATAGFEFYVIKQEYRS